MTYLVIGIGAALENIVPPVPADTFVLFGAFLAARGEANVWVVWVVTLACNVASALGVYAVCRRYGERFFDTRIGRLLLDREQLRKVRGFYERWGPVAIFFSRAIPAFRAIVPVFAGVSRIALWKVAPPLALASGLWYGFLVYLGNTAGSNWDAISRSFERFSRILLWVAIPLVLGVAYWWWRSRSGRRS